MLPAGFEAAVPASYRLQTLTLDFSVTQLGSTSFPYAYIFHLTL
jgi:hypothetical protein